MAPLRFSYNLSSFTDGDITNKNTSIERVDTHIYIPTYIYRFN